MRTFFEIFLTGAFWEMWAEIQKIPEFQALEFVEQDKGYHPEGNVKNHTFHVAHQQYELCVMLGLFGDEFVIRMLTAFFHDFGKEAKSYIHENGHTRADGHAMESAILARKILPTLGVPEHIVNAVVGLCREHMNHLQSARAVDRMEVRLAADGATLQQFIAQKIADKWGRPPIPRDIDGSLLEDITNLEKSSGVSEVCEVAREIVRINKNE